MTSTSSCRCLGSPDTKVLAFVAAESSEATVSRSSRLREAKGRWLRMWWCCRCGYRCGYEPAGDVRGEIAELGGGGGVDAD